MGSRNAAEAAPAPKHFAKTLAVQTMDRRWHTLHCGNYTYQRCPANEGGPIMLTLLRDEDRQSADNEPLHMVGGVMSFHVFDGPEPDMSEIGSLVQGGITQAPEGLVAG